MNTKAVLMLSSLVMVSTLFVLEIFSILDRSKEETARLLVKKQAVEIIQLPDLALTSEATWLRHRSLSSIFYIFPDDGALLDYYPSSFTLSMTNVVGQSRVNKP